MQCYDDAIVVGKYVAIYGSVATLIQMIILHQPTLLKK